MYLSRLTLDTRSAQARRDLSDPYEMHRTLSRAFATSEDETPARFLWRLEHSSNAWGKPQLLVQSAALSDWGVLSALPNYLQADVESKELQLESLIEPEGRYRFRLMANPTVTRQGKRYGLMTMPEQLAWLERQGERQGFVVEAALVTASDLSTSRKGDKRISFQRTCFDGLLKITSPNDIARAVQCGIGPAKAFGCGLLSLARLQR